MEIKQVAVAAGGNLGRGDEAVTRGGGEQERERESEAIPDKGQRQQGKN